VRGTRVEPGQALDDRDARGEQGRVHRALAARGVVHVERVDADQRRARRDEVLRGRRREEGVPLRVGGRAEVARPAAAQQHGAARQLPVSVAISMRPLWNSVPAA
jgi:hypothetical protein